MFSLLAARALLLIGFVSATDVNPGFTVPMAPGRGRCWISFHETCTQHPEFNGRRDDTEFAYLAMAVGDSEPACFDRAQTYWEWCGQALSQQISATFVSGRTTIFPPHDMAIAARGGMEGNLADATNISASLTEWRRQRNRGRPCGVGEHTDGRWRLKDEVELKAHPPCCDLYEQEKRDSDVCGPGPMPLQVLFPPSADVLPEYLHTWNHQFTAGRSDFLVHVGGNGCSCKDWVDRYAWEPARCSLAAWDASAFCDALGGRSLMFVGDSTTMQAGVVVINAVHWGMWNGSGCQEQISAGLSDTLIGVRLGASNRGGSWTAWVNNFGAFSRNFTALASSNMSRVQPPTERAVPDIVVLSAG